MTQQIQITKSQNLKESLRSLGFLWSYLLTMFLMDYSADGMA